ncbi:HAD family hydrolase [Williamsia sterculiae]|uniref:Phosphoglycolate phosphatase, HAD superfamily n=1 Tax=Williamsia sterculiae TaxID=1344003 RepID=A0A1N7FZ12_9NOCA|nr:HAD family hydrolase [Williamsia sterculiae]SIS05561.1 Phosphoglycolate phosphatase, HAD superfamily [Williamsia sterculiae]
MSDTEPGFGGSTRQAFLFDIDGTLVDSVYPHVDAWLRAFADCGVTIPAWEIHRQIGKDGSLLVQALLSAHGVDEASDRYQDIADRASGGHSENYLARADHLAVLPGARALIRLAAERGMTVVLATSAPQQELDILRRLLDVEQWVDAVTSGEDVDTAKPDASVVQVALDRAGTSAADAIMFGDATWDAQAATKIGVRSVGLLSGGIGAAELTDAGAARVYRDPADIVEHFDEVAARR